MMNEHEGNGTHQHDAATGSRRKAKRKAGPHHPRSTIPLSQALVPARATLKHPPAPPPSPQVASPKPDVAPDHPSPQAPSPKTQDDEGGFLQVLAAYRLTPREHQVVHGIWQCETRAMMSADLGIALSTVDSYWYDARVKLGVHTYNEARKKIDGLLADLRLKAAVAEAVAKAVREAVEPLHATIASLGGQQQVRELQEQVETLRTEKEQ